MRTRKPENEQFPSSRLLRRLRALFLETINQIPNTQKKRTSAKWFLRRCFFLNIQKFNASPFFCWVSRRRVHLLWLGHNRQIAKLPSEQSNLFSNLTLKGNYRSWLNILFHEKRSAWHNSLQSARNCAGWNRAILAALERAPRKSNLRASTMPFFRIPLEMIFVLQESFQN